MISPELRRKLAEAGAKLFLVESPYNHYQPPPPEGWFGLRSSERRIFIKGDHGSFPHPDVVARRLEQGEYIEASLTP